MKVCGFISDSFIITFYHEDKHIVYIYLYGNVIFLQHILTHAALSYKYIHILK